METPRERTNRLAQEVDPRYGELIMAWTMDEFERHERGTLWYGIFLVLILGFTIWALVTGNYIFAVLLILIGTFMVMEHGREPETVSILILTTGIVVGNHYHEWDEIKDFSIVYDPPQVRKLYLDFEKWRHPLVSIELPEDMDPNELRGVMLEFAEEDLSRKEENLTDFVRRIYRL